MVDYERILIHFLIVPTLHLPLYHVYQYNQQQTPKTYKLRNNFFYDAIVTAQLFIL